MWYRWDVRTKEPALPRHAVIIASVVFAAAQFGVGAEESVAGAPKVVVAVEIGSNVPVETAPPIGAKIGFTVLHTRNRNWLQAQIDSIGACQNLVVDSTRILDTLLPGLDSGLVLYPSPPRRDVRVWWKLVQNPPTTGCSKVFASRYMVELPPARRHMGTDSVYTSWMVRDLQAVGPLGRIDRVEPDQVNQAEDGLIRACPQYECMVRSCTSDDSAPRAQFLATMRERIALGLPVVRIGKGTGDDRVEVSISDSTMVRNLGPLTRWSAGNLAWKEDVSIRTVSAWGATAPAEWRDASGRRFYRWRNATVCCDGCDSLCQADAKSFGISSGGVDVEVSNDSGAHCGSSASYDPDLAQALSGDWLILPDSTEVRAGRLTRTFTPMACGGRFSAWPIVRDSIVTGCARIAVSDLDPALGLAAHLQRMDVRAFPDANGVRVSTGLRPGQKTTVRLRNASGRILSNLETVSTEFVVPAEARGALLLEIESAGRTARRAVVR